MSSSSSNSGARVNNRRGGGDDSEKLLIIILCIFIPPIAVFWVDRDVTIHLIINILLCFLFYIPGVIHALWYCFMRK
ncbi:hypothetical protein PRIPAC_86719 [Pristionchus pacificus]|uniref:Uncharacterized protein n=1 Tax=Pristionchus pacificus TaxID=54126 RepID=A0A2A6BSQ4_PRIPA|nr:hypothetical protein PRIPAC_86719 [Pristionchus pacificus]|eukprot:PDM68791.1 hypothetical protein PRIPAC_47093 [Pristionchus pacificus]